MPDIRKIFDYEDYEAASPEQRAAYDYERGVTAGAWEGEGVTMGQLRRYSPELLDNENFMRGYRESYAETRKAQGDD
jgi:hypothetical protein